MAIRSDRKRTWAPSWPLETIVEDPRNAGVVQISSNLKEAEKEVKHYSKVAKKYKKARSVTQYKEVAHLLDHE